MKMGYNILNVFGLGKLPFSASAASLLIIPVYWALYKWCPYPLYFNTALFLMVLGCSLLVLNRYAAYAMEDPKEVVIDEVLGMHAALILGNSVNYYVLAVLFMLFRVFDIFKIFPFNILEKKLKGKYALLWDDIAIGVFLGLAFYFVNRYWELRL
jgi:phosphatidylglycerophosphatase A